MDNVNVKKALLSRLLTDKRVVCVQEINILHLFKNLIARLKKVHKNYPRQRKQHLTT